MANITISELRPAGTELFLDSEGFISELTEEELNFTKGGITPAFFAAGFVAGYVAGKYL
ncbi:class IIb bacteriocin, lactobin A/cerein 7B family [Dapis sp. BLCC M229]|uniref:class IIb bacteriocin, lactobin A/cerein 7B family n=1 Tax=Dapis sp. BLCC M229 TaxID=3400188 RepID=UPI003CF09A4D